VADAEALAHGLYAPDPDKVAAQRAADDSIDHETPIEELFADQLRCADLIVLSKTDRLQEDDQARADAALAERRVGVGIVRSTAEGLPSELLIGLGARAESDMEGREADHHHHDHDDDHDDDHDHDHHHHHDHDEFDSRVITPKPFASKADLDAFVASLCALPGVLRVKGVAEIAGKAAPLVVQAVGPRVASHFDTSGRPQRPGLVVIGLAPCPTLPALQVWRAQPKCMFWLRRPGGSTMATSRSIWLRRRAISSFSARRKRELSAFALDARQAVLTARCGSPACCSSSIPIRSISMSTKRWHRPSSSRCRLIGGRGYWPYGLERLTALARGAGVQLVVVPGETQWDSDLAAHSTVPMPLARRFWQLCVEGGPANRIAALRLWMAWRQGKQPEPPEVEALPRFGLCDARNPAAERSDPASAGSVPIIFYASLLQSGMTAPIAALCETLMVRGLTPQPVFVPSLKDEAAAGFLAELLPANRPAGDPQHHRLCLHRVGGWCRWWPAQPHGRTGHPGRSVRPLTRSLGGERARSARHRPCDACGDAGAGWPHPWPCDQFQAARHARCTDRVCAGCLCA
jgi:hypothetical protein